MRRLLKFKRREASNGDPQGNSAITSSPPMESEKIAPSTTSRPASSLKLQPAGPSVGAASSSPTTVGAAQSKSEQDVASISPSTGSSPPPYSSTSQDNDTWSRAYELAANREPDLMRDYANHLASLQPNSTTKRNISSSDFVEDVVNQLLEDRQKKQWRLPLLGDNVIIRKQVEKLTKVLLWSDPVIKRAVSFQPYAALAWSSVSILLPLVASAATPNEAMLKGFNSISDVQIYWTIFEETYLTSAHREHYENLIEPLIKLYSHIIEYQARAICHLSKAQLSRGWQNVTGWNDWAGKTGEIEALSTAHSSLISLDNEKEVRERWDRQLREIQESSAILKEIQQVLDESRRQTQRNYEGQAEKELLQDLASDYEGYKDFNRLRVQGTCEWFFNDDKFCKWRDSNTSGLLWLSAGPGCGKSILSRSLIDERRLSLNVTTSTVCHFFFKDGYEDRMYGVNALCAVLHQLFTRDSSGTLIKLALPAHKNYGKALTRSFSELWNILLACAKSPHAGEVICIFDALDECEKQSRLQLIKKLEEFYSQPHGSSALSSKLSFLITSRPYADIERDFKGFSTAEYLHFDGDKESPAIRWEIDLVIDEHVSQIAGNFTLDDQQEISKRIKSMENRTYLWLHVIFETIKEDPSRHGKRSSIQKLLNNIPSKLSEAYEKILSRSKCQEETERLLEIILAAARPLTLDEANVALTLALAEETFNSHATLEDDLWPKNNFESIVKGLSGLFISVHDSKLFLIHQTAREFLIDPSGRGTWEGRLSMSKATKTISRTCLQFLMLPDLRALVEDIASRGDNGYEEDGPNRPTLDQMSPFFRYAANHWSLHFLSQEAAIIDQTLKDARTLCNRHQAWVWAATSGWGQLDFQDMTDLSLASYLGLKQVVEHILSEEHIDVNSENESSASALSAACSAGQSDVVTLLLSKGANCNSRHIRYGTALHIALLSRQQDIVPILLKNGADVNSKGGESGTALYIATTSNYPNIVLALLESGADVNYSEGMHGTALDGACREGNQEIVKILLDNGADVNSKGGLLGTTLFIASSRNEPDIVLILLERGADVNYRHELQGTALHGACYRGNSEIVKILLENGADANSEGGRFGKPLYLASTENYPEIVTILLENGADVNYCDPMDGTALLGACCQGHGEVVKILLENGAVDFEHGYYGSALHVACNDIEESDIAICLLENIVYSDIRYNHQTHGTPLQTASKKGRELIVRILLAIGADPNFIGRYGSSAIEDASYYGHQAIVKLLLENGADVNFQGEGKSTALQMAAAEGHGELVALLLEHGADITIKGELYGTALDAATEQGHTEIMEMLAKKSAEV
ncbi:hypothetical protein N7517_004591 [Penicillium concentricum]|uniref:NWD NACHT-NTPase N-terminal domain-containing protein n=1 Tax=Penicillium concentricum TaxID=293559 RepID=A0A9W9S739_9EURO|nr:uncharacterized protein N7517_004591 [Penicillium concentricum]KAJ5372585.1 hypothetical protein N7517_004591 [Penicillium concentricum]